MPKAASKGRRSKPARKDPEDDTPRGFKRVMSLKERHSQPRQARPAPARVASEPAPAPALKIKPGESMLDFSRRVNEAIPLPRAKGVESRKASKISNRQRRKADNLRAEYHQRWEKKRKQLGGSDDDADGMPDDDDEDIWAKVNAKAPAPKFGEIADRPPELPSLKAKSNIPKSAGSLARRQMLEEERARFIEEYRKLRGTAPEVVEE